MKDIILKVENVSKQYRLGQVGTGTLSHDLNRWWHQICGKEDPYLKVGDTNDRTKKGDSEYVWALQDINFEVERGEILGIIGKNGAGKSTLLKILSKVTTPTTGSIKSRGRIASLLEVGTGFNPELTGRENIYLNGAILGMTKKEITQKLPEIIEFSGCERYIDTPTKRYSSGMTVRLAFAVAAFLEPEILVVDEVLAVGDAEFQKKAIGKMQDISRSGGRTVLFVSHDMAAIKSLCNRLLIVENGTIGYQGAVEVGIETYITKSSSIMEKENVILKKGVLLKNFFLVDQNRSVGLVEVFKPVEIKGTLYFEKELPTDIKIEIVVKNNFGQIMTVMSTWLNSIIVEPKGNEMSFCCFLKNGLSIAEGEYFIDLKVLANEWIEFRDVLVVEVVNSLFTEYKFPIKRHVHGSIYTPNTWTID
jgi:lipopolysaccharide transport system ATP-binding protein